MIGSDNDHCSEKAYRTAYHVGLEVAKRGAVLITGGLGGVMEAASKGAQEAEGFVIGIVPQEEKTAANPYCDAVIATGLGHARDFITAYSADAIIIVGGGAGTTIEVAAAYQKKIPMVALKGSGGTADTVINHYFDERELELVLGETSPEKAVETALRLIEPART